MRDDGPSNEVVWRPGRLDKGRALARRLLAATLGNRGEALAHSAYHRFLRRVGRFGPPEDAATLAALHAVASRSRTIIDIGANVGRYSWYLGRHARDDATLFALEPHPGSARLLREAVASLRGSVVLELAAAEIDGSAQLIVPTGAFGSSVAGLAWVQNEPHADAKAAVRIPVRRLDGLVSDGSITVVGPVFMKIDVEGGEAGVLRGAAGLLKRHRPVVYFESQASLLARFGETPEGVWRTLGRAGYRIFAIKDGAFVRVPYIEPGIVNYLGIPDVGTSGRTDQLDIAGIGTVLDAWASHAWQH